MAHPVKTMEEVIQKLEQIADDRIISEEPDFCPADTGNFDDTFEMGVGDGQVILARELLEFITGKPESFDENS